MDKTQAMKKMSKSDRENIQDILALTPMQEGLLFHYLKEPTRDLYFTQLCLEISGKPDIEILTAAWNFVVKTNEMLRTSFRWENVKNPVQIILKDHSIRLQYIDFSAKPASEKINRLEEIKDQDRQEGFDLREVPFRIILCKWEDAGYYMIISNHHILYDGWSNGIILKEFFAAYRQLLKGKSITGLILPQKKNFKEFVRWIQQQDKDKNGEREETFWKQYLGNFAGEARIPLRPKKSLHMKEKDRKETIRYQSCLSPITGGSLERFAAAFNITPALLFYTAWGVLLQRYSNSEDVLFGTTVSGRSAKLPGMENMVGLFINTLPLRLQASRDETIEAVLYKNNCHWQEREAYEHTPLVKIKQYSSLGGDETFFDSLVVVENYPLHQQLTYPNQELYLTSYSIREQTHFDVTVGIHTRMDNEIAVDLSCHSDCFDEAASEQMGRHFVSIVKYMVKNPRKPIGEIDFLGIGEKKQILMKFNKTRVEFTGKSSLRQLFEEQVEKTPDNIAIVAPLPIEDRTHMTYMTYISYRELNKKSNQLAYLLHEKRVEPDTIVGIMVERSLEMIMGILGILKAGGAYLPIDPDYPQERINYMLLDSNARILLKKSGIRDPKSCCFQTNPNDPYSTYSNGQNKRAGISILDLEYLNFEFFMGCPRRGPSNFVPANLAYTIYTSGSGGKPKGVLVEQVSVVNLLMALHRCYPLNRNDAYLLKTSFLFDVSVTELFGWILGGGRLAILEPGGEKNPQKILDAIEKNRATHINFIPSMFNMLTAVLNPGNIGTLSSLRYIFLAGEALLPEQFNRFEQLNLEIALENLYGPTEGTVYASGYSLSQWDGAGSIPIGKPLPNLKLYILAKDDHLQPLGVPGELCISGIGLARGYLNNPELTDEKFDHDLLDLWDYQDEEVPFGLILNAGGEKKLTTKAHQQTRRKPHSPLYHTGDLARWLADGNIEFLGRKDHQVKIRGFRIELGEIESQLYTYKGISEAVVTTFEARSGEYDLCAYIAAGTGVDVLQLKQYLARKLPNYMVPSYFVRMDKVPRVSIGKIDRKKLPDPKTSARTFQLIGKGAGTEPKSDWERQIAGIWQEVLRLNHVGSHDNFFDIGGNSLSIIRLNSRLNEVFQKDIPLVMLFNYPTISSLAGYLSQEKEQAVESRFKASPHPDERSGKTGVEIAVIGMAGRFPGAKNIHEFRENLENGVESITFLTKNESIEPDPEWFGDTGYIPAKGILEDKNHFDAFFFGYTPAEAKIMDPQVRIFHECCWEALEDAGYTPGIDDRTIGLYAGASPNPYWEIFPLRSRSAGGESYARQWEAVQFSDKDYLSTRIAYKLDLKGPCITMQTACSTSLVVVSLACQGLIGGTCDMALAGGVSVTFYDEAGYVYQEGTIMSADGHCRAFDARANGTVGGNGAGVVVLKRLDEALKDRDAVYAVIKGFGLNNDGKSKVGFTAPSVPGQAGAIRAALRTAGVEPGSIGYIETHGTGTPLGDPIEIEALKQAFAASQTVPGKKNYCALGSVKTNIGHLDAAAGIAGLIKTVLMLKYRFLPPHLHFQQPNPAIDFENSPFYINKGLKPWQNDKYPLRAGVSSFGLGGTNAHVVLEEAPLVPTPGRKAEETRALTPLSMVKIAGQGRGGVSPPGGSQECQLILLSAQTPAALDNMTRNLAEHFGKNPGIELADAAYTLQVGRKAFAHRRMLVCSNPEEAVRKIHTGEVETGREQVKPTVIFMFSGQGSQFVNMGLDLYREEPVFREQMDYCFRHLENLTGIDMKPVLYPDLPTPPPTSPLHPSQEGAEGAEAGDKINQFLYTTPIKFIFEYSLAKLFISWGIQPDAMIGHSFGEYAAACLSGVFSLEDALFMAALRGRLMHGLPDGAMLSVPLSETRLKPLLNDEISLAAVNGAAMCVVSGPTRVIDAFEQELKEKGQECLRYHVPKAGHSRMVEPILAEFKEKIGQVKWRKPRVPYISGLTGKWITAAEAMDPGYWTRHLREPVRFANGLTTLFKEPNPIFLQIAPGRGLTLFVSQHPDKKPGTPIFNMVRHRKEKISDMDYTLNKIGQLWLQGVSIDGASFYARQKRFRLPLPTYPFENKYYHPPKDLLKLDVQRSSAKLLLTHKTDMSDWFYIPVWEQLPLTLTSSPTTQPGKERGFVNWLVFMDDLGLGTLLIKALPKAAREVVTVKIGDEYTRESKNSYSLNPGQANHYERLFQELRQSGRLPDRIIHLWSVTDNPKPGDGLKELDRIQNLGFYSLIYMVQAVGRQDISREIQIKVVTNNMQSVTGEEDTCPEKATIRGAVKIIPLEYVNIKCTSIDILLSGPGPGSQIKDQSIPQLLKELLADNDNDNRIIALRGSRRWCETMKPCPLRKQDPAEELPAEKGVYLITGGLGGMGFTFARHLAKDFKAKLILVGRSSFPARQDWTQWLAHHPADDKISIKIRQIQEWEEWGAEIMVGSADVSNPGQMRAIIDEAHQRFGTINGVLHTAGKGDYAGMIRQRTREMTEQVMAPKVRGTLVLEEVLKDDRLDFLVLFSSIGNIIYQVKFAQVGYNAANEFLEAFAYYKTRKDGTYTVTINWNDWLEVGMSIEATNRKYQKHWKYKLNADLGAIDYESAIHAGITPAQGVEVLRRILGRPLERVTVSIVDPDEMVRVLKGLKEKDPGTFEAVEEQAAAMETVPRPPLRTPYLPPADPVEEALCDIWSNYFGIRSVGTADDFFELGGDSLKAMIINQKIHKELEIRIPLADFFNNPTIKAQAEYIRLTASRAPRTEKRIYSSITPAEKKEYYLLSSAQQRIYTLHRLAENSISYNITHTVLLDGEIDKRRLASTFTRLIHRHESLRTSFHIIGDQPLQKVHAEVDFEVENLAVKAGVEKGDQETGERIQHTGGKSDTYLSSVIRRLSSAFIRPFDLSHAPLLRVGLMELSHSPAALRGRPCQEGKQQQYILIIDTHHIISDGTSVDVLTKEFAALYQGDTLPGLRLRYKDYSQWQHRQGGEKPAAEKIKEQESFWLKQLAGELPVLSLPLDYPRPPVQSFAGSSRVFEINPRETKRLKTLAGQEETTLFTVLLTLCNTWLARLSGQEEVILGSVTAGREFEELQPVIGMFVNTVVLRNFPMGTKTFKQFLREVRAKTLAAFENRDYPFKDLVEKVAIERDTSRNPLFDVMFVLQNKGITHRQIPGLTIKPCPVNTGIAKFDLSLEAAAQENKVLLNVEYCTKLFKAETIERLIDCFSRIVSTVVMNPGIRLREIEIISDREKQRVLYDFNDTCREYPADKTLQQLFAQQVETTPDNIALAAALTIKTRSDKAHMTHISYRELNKKSRQLAHFLKEKGIKPDAVVGIMVKRSIEMIIGLLGILKAGGAYLPIDPDYPQHRIDFMLNDSSAKILLTNREIMDLSSAPAFKIRPKGASIYRRLSPWVNAPAASLAYIIYTSGSTGKPKGVLVEHKNVVRLVKNSNYIHGEPGDKLLATGSVIFDISTFEIWWPLLNGLTLVLADENAILDAEKLEETLVKNNVTILHLVPQLFNQMAAQHPQLFGHIKYFLVGGDVVSPEYINRVRSKTPGLKILHMYGPTENTTFSTFFPVDRELAGNIPIGKPIGNTTIYILDRYTGLQPIGVAGELCVGGKGLARGYLNQPGLTAEKFLSLATRSYRSDKSYRTYIYRTGDLARWLSDGSIEFSGRIDHQVKIRGIRIELGEIENRLLKHDQVNEAAVVMKSRCLCAYVVLSTSSPPLVSRELKKYLAQFLPGYMIPTYFTQLQAMPLTPNGKIDRKAFPEPGPDPTMPYTAPGNKIEKKLVEIWSGILGRKTGIDDNFFEIGGHSLNAAVLIAKIHREFNVKLSLTEFFRMPFIRETVEYINRAAGEKYIRPEPAEKREHYPLAPTQKRLYILQQMETGGIGYNMPMAISLEGQLDRKRLEQTFQALIHRHESFRTSFELVKNKPVQRVNHQVKFEIEQIANNEETKGHPSAFSLQHSFARPFDLSRAPLLRVGLTARPHTPPAHRGRPSQQEKEHKYILMLDMHHIIFDGTSMAILVREFMDLYARKNLPALRTQYKDYSQWQQCEKQLTALKKQKDYWLGQLSGELPVLTLPADYPRPLVRSFSGRTVTFALDKTLSTRLSELARQADVTLFMVLLAVFNVFLAKLGGQEDILVGIPVTARSHEDWQHIIGMFVNTLVSRNQPCGEKPFSDFLEQLKTRVLADFENHDYPFDDLVENLEIKRSTGGNPIFDVMFAFQDINIPSLEIPGLKLQPYDFDMGISKFDLILETVEKEEILYFNLQYCTALFKQETIQRFMVYFKNLIRDVIGDHKRRISDFEIISEEEKERILFEFADSGAEYTKDKILHKLFAEQVQRTPHLIALIDSEQRFVNMTYQELHERSHWVALALKEKCVKPGDIAAILMKRSIDMIIGILGILKSGAAYLPLNPEQPEARTHFMMKDSRARVLVLKEERHYRRIEENKNPEVLTLDTSAFSSFPASLSRHLPYPIPDIGPGNPAYVMYTSGSTGNPKGVPITHRNFSPLIHWGYRHLGINEKDRVIQNLSYYFDWSVWEIFITLTSGASLHIVPGDIVPDADRYVDFINRCRITVLHITPTHFQSLSHCGRKLNTLGHLCLGAEKLTDDLVKRSFALVREECRVFNMYGPTEATIISAVLEIPKPNYQGDMTGSSVPIGRPAGNTTLLVLDKYKKLCPVNIVGELYIGGAGVAGGYLNNPELTTDKFLLIFNRSDRSYMTYISGRLYTTGDLVKWLPDGNIEFLGRKDHQVKIRGYRIEPEEIENLLLRHHTVKDAVVTVIEKDKEKYICAYIVSDAELAASALRNYLAERLPAYMIPSYFMQLPQIPLTPNGKADKKALPAPAISVSKNYTAPRDEIEKKLLEIWLEILCRDASHASHLRPSLGIDDDFFELGGHSLKATSLTSKIHKEFNVRLSLSEFFSAPYIRQTAEYIKNSTAEKYIPPQAVEEKEYYRLSSAHKRLYVLQELEADSISYNMCAVFSVEGEPGKERFEEIFQKLMRRHESLRTSFHMMANEPVQRTRDAVEFGIEYYDLQVTDAGDGHKWKEAPCGQTNACGNGERERADALIRSFIRPFDLSRAPLLRVGLIKSKPNRYILMVDMHHIISDGTSTGILMAEFMTLYSGKTPPELPVRYKDYTAWQEKIKGGSFMKKQEEYWLKELQGELKALNLPHDFPRPEIRQFKGRHLEFEIPEHRVAALKQLAREQDTTLYVVLLVVINIFLAKLCGQEEIIIGTAVANRRHTELEHIIGMFVNTLIIRNYPRADLTVSQFLDQVNTRTIKAHENQEYPFDDLVEKIVGKRARDAARNPLFDVIFALHNMEIPQVHIPGLKFSPYAYETGISQFDLILMGVEEQEKLKMQFSYSLNLFRQQTVQRFIRYFREIMDSVLENKEIKIKEINISHDLVEPKAAIFHEARGDFDF